MTEMFPGQHSAGDYQEQKTPETEPEPETEYPADSESQADKSPAVDPEALQEEKGRLRAVWVAWY